MQKIFLFQENFSDIKSILKQVFQLKPLSVTKMSIALLFWPTWLAAPICESTLLFVTEWGFNVPSLSGLFLIPFLRGKGLLSFLETPADY